MTNDEAVNWIINISADIGKAEHRDLWHYEQALSEIREMLEDAPTIEERKWIPCSERLPDEARTYYLVTLKDNQEVDIAYLTEYGTWETFRNDDVTAWMPLPEPFREEGEQDD